MSDWYQPRPLWELVRLALIVVAVVVVTVGGYLSATRIARTEGDVTYVTQRVITVVRKNRPPQVITTTLPVKTVPGETVTRVVTVRRNGRNVIVRIPGPTVTTSRIVRRPGKRVVVTRTQKQTSTVVRDRLVTRPGVTVSLPGSTVTTPGATETVVRQTPGPVTTETAFREVTLPTVTQTQTVTHEVTLPQQTVTQTQTVTEQETVTVTVTEPPSP